MLRDSNQNLRINGLDPHVCRIAPKMLWVHYVVGVSRFGEFRNNRPVTVREVLINLLKSPTEQWRVNWKIDPECVSGTHLYITYHVLCHA